jgi:hypothetical protein
MLNHNLIYRKQFGVINYRLSLLESNEGQLNCQPDTPTVAISTNERLKFDTTFLLCKFAAKTETFNTLRFNHYYFVRIIIRYSVMLVDDSE